LTDAPAALDAMRAERDAEIERSDDLCGQVSTALVERNAMRAERDEASGVAMALSAQVDDLTRQLVNVREVVFGFGDACDEWITLEHMQNKTIPDLQDMIDEVKKAMCADD